MDYYRLVCSTGRRSITLLLLLLGLGCSAPVERVPLVVGSVAPSFELETTLGADFDSRSLLGEPTVLVFWATWCLPCLEEIPLLTEIEASGVGKVVAISLDEAGPERVERFRNHRGMDYTVLMGDEEIFRRYDGLAIPYTIILDQNFEIIAKHRGRLERQTLLDELSITRQES